MGRCRLDADAPRPSGPVHVYLEFISEEAKAAGGNPHGGGHRRFEPPTGFVDRSNGILEPGHPSQKRFWEMLSLFILK